MEKKTLLARFLIWRARHIPQRQFLLFLSFVIGILSGLAAVGLKNLIHLIGHLLTGEIAADKGNLLYLAYPLIGIFLTWLFVRYVVKESISHGVSRILYAISKRGSILKQHNNYSSMVASVLTIGFGGSVGAEAPIVLTGASMGSSLGRWLHLNYRARTVLLGCGAAGAIAGIFKAPIAGVVFTLEILMLDLTLSSVVPLLISSVTAAAIAYFLMGQGAIFAFQVNEPFALSATPFYLLLGVFTGLVSFYFTRISMVTEQFFEENIRRTSVRVITAGIILGVLIYLFPSLYGEGYQTISALLSGNVSSLIASSPLYGIKDYVPWFILYILFVILLKAVAMAVTNGAGGVGGVFAPSLFTGGVSGFFFARVLNQLPGVQLSESSFALVGMAGLMAGVMHAPLTGIFLIAEITGGYTLLFPLMITATVAYLTIVAFEPHSIYTKRLARRGELITHDKDRAVLTLMNWKKVIERDLITLSPEDSLGSLVQAITKSKRNIFPVVDAAGRLEGVVMLDQVREIMFNRELYDEVSVRELMVSPPAIVQYNDTMEQVLRKFSQSGAWNLPVLEGEKYVGILSKSRVYSAYRRILRQVSEE